MNVLRPLYREVLQARTIKNLRIGERFSVRRYDYENCRDTLGNFEIVELYLSYARCKNLKNGMIECFCLGDFVIMGKEPVWDNSFGVDPRLKLDDFTNGKD